MSRDRPRHSLLGVVVMRERISRHVAQRLWTVILRLWIRSGSTWASCQKVLDTSMPKNERIGRHPASYQVIYSLKQVQYSISIFPIHWYIPPLKMNITKWYSKHGFHWIISIPWRFLWRNSRWVSPFWWRKATIGRESQNTPGVWRWTCNSERFPIWDWHRLIGGFLWFGWT